jgi:hypothetical protein
VLRPKPTRLQGILLTVPTLGERLAAEVDNVAQSAQTVIAKLFQVRQGTEILQYEVDSGIV